MKILIVLRSFVFSVLYVPFLLLSSFIYLFCALLIPSRPLLAMVIKIWGQVSCRGCGVVPRLIGAEKLPPGGYIALFNHTSFFDIFAVLALLPRVRFGAKIELFKIPLFGRAMRAAGALPIDRGNREEVFRIYEEARERLAQGESFILAPEGTRQETEKLGPFKAGPFIFAINSGATIVPMVIRGAAVILPKKHLLPNLRAWRSEITVEILDPISTEGIHLDDRSQLQQRVFQAMQEALQKT